MKIDIKIKKGFTLLELIIALALTSIILLAVFAFVTSSQAQYNRISLKSNLQYEAQEANGKLSKTVMQCVRIENIDIIDDVHGNVEKLDLKLLFDNSDKENPVYKNISFNKNDNLLKFESASDTKYVEGLTLYYVDHKNGDKLKEIKPTDLDLSNPDRVNLDELSYLKLKLDFKDKDEKYSIENELKLRNHKSIYEELEDEIELFNKTIKEFDLKKSEFAEIKDNTFTIKNKINTDTIQVYTMGNVLKVTTKIGVAGSEKTVVIANNLKEFANNRTPGDIKDIKRFKIIFSVYGKKEEYRKESDEFNLGS